MQSLAQEDDVGAELGELRSFAGRKLRQAAAPHRRRRIGEAELRALLLQGAVQLLQLLAQRLVLGWGEDGFGLALAHISVPSTMIRPTRCSPASWAARS